MARRMSLRGLGTPIKEHRARAERALVSAVRKYKAAKNWSDRNGCSAAFSQLIEAVENMSASTAESDHIGREQRSSMSRRESEMFDAERAAMDSYKKHCLAPLNLSGMRRRRR